MAEETSARRAELKRLLQARLSAEGNFATAIDGVGAHRFDSDSAPRPHFYKPMLIIIAQGSKWLRIGQEEYVYGERDCFVSGINMPLASCILGASPDNPYLALSMDLDREMLAGLAAELKMEAAGGMGHGALVQTLTGEMLDAAIRLVKLLDQPRILPVLAPMLKRELHLHLLIGPFGSRLSSIYAAHGKFAQIEKAVYWLRQNFREPVKIGQLAALANMGVSTFHKYFKEATTLSPLNYQKRLRLAEAQRLLLNGECDVTRAALAVGYESQPQFSRDYKRFYGESPLKDIARLRRRPVFRDGWSAF